MILNSSGFQQISIQRRKLIIKHFDESALQKILKNTNIKNDQLWQVSSSPLRAFSGLVIPLTVDPPICRQNSICGRIFKARKIQKLFDHFNQKYF